MYNMWEAPIGVSDENRKQVRLDYGEFACDSFRASFLFLNVPHNLCYSPNVVLHFLS